MAKHNYNKKLKRKLTYFGYTFVSDKNLFLFLIIFISYFFYEIFFSKFQLHARQLHKALVNMNQKNRYKKVCSTHSKTFFYHSSPLLQFVAIV